MTESLAHQFARLLRDDLEGSFAHDGMHGFPAGRLSVIAVSPIDVGALPRRWQEVPNIDTWPHVEVLIRDSARDGLLLGTHASPYTPDGDPKSRQWLKAASSIASVNIQENLPRAARPDEHPEDGVIWS